MFTEKKFKSLEPQLRCRKAARILKDAEEALRRGCPVDTPYLEMILRNALEEPEVRLENTSQGFFLRSINSYKYKVMDKVEAAIQKIKDPDYINQSVINNVADKIADMLGI